MTQTELLMVAGMTAVTFGIRYGMLMLVTRLTLPPAAVRALRYVPVAVLTAITVPTIAAPAGAIDVSPGNAYLYAGIIAALIAWRTRNLLLTIVLGMAVFFAWGALF
jgi:branched-subunit amino acid transport protein